MSGHEVYTTSSRYGAYAHCACGWSSGCCRSRLHASVAWATLHMATLRGRRRRDGNGRSRLVTVREQVGWMNPETGVMCDCPVYETSPHAKSVPVYREVQRRG